MTIRVDISVPVTEHRAVKIIQSSQGLYGEIILQPGSNTTLYVHNNNSLTITETGPELLTE